MERKIAVAVAATLALGYVFFSQNDGALSGAEARRLVADGALLLDVRTPAEYQAGHVGGAVNIPVQDLERRIDEITPKDRPVVLYCQSGNRSGRAARMLTQAGYRSVHDLGAMSRW